jgi:hypothetical protein
MAGLDDVIQGVRVELQGVAVVRDLPATVQAMVRAFRQSQTDSQRLSGSDVARMLGVSRQAVQQRAARGSLLVDADGDGVRYPAWQFRDGKVVRGLGQLVRAARLVGVDDTSLVIWIETDPNRRRRVASGDAAVLTSEVKAARRRRTRVSRQRVTGKAPRLSDAAAG